jgi:multidrug resistance efflux pump
MELNVIGETGPRRAQKAPVVLIVSAIVAGLLLVIITTILLFSRRPSPSPQSFDLNQHCVLCPTNGILKRILAREGEYVTKSASLVQMSTPAYEQRVRDARAAVTMARLALEEARLSAAAQSAPGHGSQPPLPPDRTRAAQKQQAIQDQKLRARNIAAKLKATQATLTDLQAQPFNARINAQEIEAQQKLLTQYQAELDVTNVELKRLQSEAAGNEPDSAGMPRDLSSTNRRLQTARDELTQAEVVLAEIQKEEPDFTELVCAPFSAQIIRHLHTEGRYVRQGQPLLILMQQADQPSR